MILPLELTPLRKMVKHTNLGIAARGQLHKKPFMGKEHLKPDEAYRVILTT